MLYNKRKIGMEKEQLAETFLKQEGYQIFERNFFSPYGEIDIIGKNEGYLVFIEVKFRRNTKKGWPEEAIDRKKRSTIINTARYYLYKNKIAEDTPCRFDVVSILGGEKHVIKNAFMM